MKKILMFLLLGMFMVSFVTAWDWDNVKEYDEEVKTVLIENALGLGDDLMTVKLETPQIYQVRVGYQKVMEFKINPYEDYENILGIFEYKDMQDEGKAIDKNIDIKYWGTENYQVNNYSCSNITLKDGTPDTKCIISGTTTNERKAWVDWDERVYQNKEVLVGLFTMVGPEETVDIIPTIAGIKIPEWAIYTSSNITTYDGGYVVVTYLNNGTFNVTGSSIIADILVIAGGGGGGNDDYSTGDRFASGGGAGGLLYNASSEISVGNYNIVIGEGGAGAVGDGTGSNGQNSSFSTMIAIGGGNGGGHGGSPPWDRWAGNGGSGGGASTTATAIGNGTAGQGHNGGNTSGLWCGGGGGGSYEKGYDSLAGSDGGSGLNYTINGSNTYYAGGGGGAGAGAGAGCSGDGGLGGGADGNPIKGSAGNNGIDGLGGGGGASRKSTAGDGGSGVVIIRYINPFLAPLITLISPSNDSNLTSAHIDFIASITDSIAVTNVSLYIDGILNESNSSGVNGTYIFSKILSEGSHNWSIEAVNSYGTSNQSDEWIFNYTQIPIYINLLSPIDTYTSEIPLVNVSCNAYADGGILQLNLTINGSLNKTITNSTNAENLTLEQVAIFNQGNYTWGCSSLGPTSYAASANKTFEVLYSNPVVNLLSPENSSSVLTENAVLIFNASDINGISNVTLFIDGVSSGTNLSGLEENYSFPRILADGVYNWSAGVISTLGKITNSTTWYFTLHTTSPVADISAPSGLLGYFLLGANETLDYNISEPGENSSHFDECWYIYPAPTGSLIDNKICYQETANVSTSCGGLSTGGYFWEPAAEWANEENMIDADWSTSGYYGLSFGTQFFYINYTIPAGSNNVTWNYKFDRFGASSGSSYNCLASNASWIQTDNLDNGAGPLNGSINVSADCLINDTLQIRLDLADGELFYEEAIDWDYSVDLNCSENTRNFIYIEEQNSITIFVKDDFGFIANDTSSWEYTLLEINQTYSSAVYETAQEDFLMSLQYNTSIWDSFSAIFNYGGVDYTATVTGSNNLLQPSYSLSIPAVTADENKTFYWVVSLTNTTGTYDFQSDSKNQTVSRVLFELCAYSESPQLFFKTFSTTSPDTALNATFSSAWVINDVDGGSSVLTRSFEDLTETNSSWGFCITPNSTNYTVSADIVAGATNYTDTSHYIVDADYSDQGQNISLYLLGDGDATLTQIIIKDQDNKPVEDVYTSIQRYDLGTDTYYNVGMTKSDSDGSDLTYLKWYDTWYRFIGTLDGTVVFTEGPVKISESPKIIKYGSAAGSDYEKFRDISYGLTFNEATDNFVLSFIDATGTSSSSCLRTIKRNVTADYLICEICETSSSATLYCNIAAFGNGTFIADYYATGSPRYYIDSLTELKNIQNEFYELIGNDNGTGLAILVAGIILSMFLITPALGVMGAILGMILGVALGFQPMDYTSMIGIVVVGVAVMWAVQK